MIMEHKIFAILCVEHQFKWKCFDAIQRYYDVSSSPHSLAAAISQFFYIFSSHISLFSVEKRNVIEKLERSLKIVIMHVYCQFPRSSATAP